MRFFFIKIKILLFLSVSQTSYFARSVSQTSYFFREV